MTRWFVEKTSYAATLIGFRIGCLAVRYLPRSWLFGVCDALANLGFLLFRRYRTRSMINLGVALAAQAGRINARVIARRSLRNFFRACVEIVIALESSDDDRRAAIPVDGREHLETALAKGNGVIVLSAHLGNFFLLGTRLALEGHPIHVLINQPGNGRLAKLLDDYRLQVKLRTIHARPRRQALRELNAILRRNGIVVMIADEYRKGSGIPAKLFGRTVVARRGPATLASRTGAAVVPACLVRQPDDSLTLVIEPELELLRSGKGEREIRENTLRMTHWLERTVRTYPDQWNWMNIRWWRDTDTGTEAPQVKVLTS
jgi:lauroyl/myristoyl acyltransferase